MRLISTLLLLIICCKTYSATLTAVQVVNEYAENLNAWSNTKDVRYSQAIEALCSNAFRVSDDIIDDYITEKKMTRLAHYDFSDYELCLQNLISNGSKIKISNVKVCEAPEFTVHSFGFDVTYVSGDISVEGSKNYFTKELFYINNKSNKIEKIRNHNSDYSLRKAFNLCKQKKYDEAYDVFESLIYTSNSLADHFTALDFALAILIKKGNQLKMPDVLRKYRIARNIYKRGYNGYRDANLPILDDKNYDYYLWNMSNIARDRVVVFPNNYHNFIPYTRYKDTDDMGHVRYYKSVFSHYRPIERKRFAKYSNKTYGYIDENGETIIPTQFKFAYPFDEKLGIALVQYANSKWGYIDMFGKPLFEKRFDVASDMFVNGKTWVIKENHLILIDSKGNELKTIYGYTDISHKLRQDVLMALNCEDSVRYDLYDFNGNLIQKDCINKKYKAYNDYDVYWLESAYDDTGGCSLGDYYIHHQIIGHKMNTDFTVSSEDVIDLGLSVKWSGHNMGAMIATEFGDYYFWGDPTGKETKEPVYDKNNNWIDVRFGGKIPPLNICGTSLDIATNLLGKDWRLPTEKEFQELIERCSWNLVNYKNKVGYLITGPNGNSIFIMYGTSLWSGEIFDTKYYNAKVLDLGKSVKIQWGWRSDKHNVRPVYTK